MNLGKNLYRDKERLGTHALIKTTQIKTREHKRTHIGRCFGGEYLQLQCCICSICWWGSWKVYFRTLCFYSHNNDDDNNSSNNCYCYYLALKPLVDLWLDYCHSQSVPLLLSRLVTRRMGRGRDCCMPETATNESLGWPPRRHRRSGRDRI